jgi:hypothetical protein
VVVASTSVISTQWYESFFQECPFYGFRYVMRPGACCSLASQGRLDSFTVGGAISFKDEEAVAVLPSFEVERAIKPPYLAPAFPWSIYLPFWELLFAV